MSTATPEFIQERFELADRLLEGWETMLEPQDLPGRYGRVVQSIDHVLEITQTEAVMAGGWAVWRHGYQGRLTQDVDIVLPADHVAEFVRVATFAGFEALAQPAGRWPKLLHKETQVKVDILPEGERPGTEARPAPTTIPHPSHLGARGPGLRYIDLASLIELKLAAGRAQDQADVVKLLRQNPNDCPRIREHLVRVHTDYVRAFDELAARGSELEER